MGGWFVFVFEDWIGCGYCVCEGFDFEGNFV